MNLVNCYIEHPVSAIDQCYTYQFHDEKIEPGMRIKVDFAHRSCIAFVDEVIYDAKDSFTYEIKDVLEVIDTAPILNDELMELGKWMAKTTVSPVISCFQAMLPAKLKPKTSKQRIKMEKWVRLLRLPDAMTAKRQEALDDLKAKGEMTLSEWRLKYKSVGKALETCQAVEIFDKEAKAKEEVIQVSDFDLTLSEEQTKAVESVLHPKKPVLCLHGVTGSGKTEVFLRCAKEVLKQGKQVLLLVPEIALTPMMVERVQKRFGNDVAIYHSALNDQEKYEQFQSVRNHEKNIVVGTRSAIFMPFDALGLIILDEEHDSSYKQDSQPQYHCRDVALWRGERHHATVLLASATPSLETYARAIKDVYQLITLKSRVTNNMPVVSLINMQKEVKKGGSYILSPPLIEAMKASLDKHEQVILLLNRRGYQPTIHCSECGTTLMCPHCDRALVYHKDDQSAKCHLCGYSIPVPSLCPSCKSPSLKGMGFGTQRLAEAVMELFPNKKIIRMDADTTSRKNAHRDLLEQFGRHEADILLGTQMIAKGLDFENVTLVGILQGDAMLYRSDYRGNELTFDLLCQASGRSGRGQKQGKVLLQVFDDQHYAIRCALKHDYLKFFEQEMQYRHLAGYPPYTFLASILYIHKDKELAYETANKGMLALGNSSFRLLGPSELMKIKDEYRFRICIKSKTLKELQEAVYQLSRSHRSSKSKVRLQIDINPLNMD